MKSFPSTTIRIASALNVLLGTAVLVSGWLEFHQSVDSSPALSALVIGSFIVICAALRAIWPARTLALSGANIALGFWTAASPWTYGYTTDIQRLDWMIGLGGAVMAVSIFGLYCMLRAEKTMNQ
ncbi:MAG TPA: hypothetical protein VFS52_05900 [Steroidobacteraceae bacterium]|jgi:hypothetical protein|nr:hypothetical protein [Steroidobacteraceae bacterium]